MNNTTANMPLKDSLKPSPLALLPIGVFLVIYAGSGIIFHDFYNMPAIIAFLAALLTAFLQTRTLSFSEKITVIAKGLADENYYHVSDFPDGRRIFRSRIRRGRR